MEGWVFHAPRLDHTGVAWGYRRWAGGANLGVARDARRRPRVGEEEDGSGIPEGPLARAVSGSTLRHPRPEDARGLECSRRGEGRRGSRGGWLRAEPFAE
jgi:hypothetical protein